MVCSIVDNIMACYGMVWNGIVCSMVSYIV